MSSAMSSRASSSLPPSPITTAATGAKVSGPAVGAEDAVRRAVVDHGVPDDDVAGLVVDATGRPAGHLEAFEDIPVRTGCVGPRRLEGHGGDYR